MWFERPQSESRPAPVTAVLGPVALLRESNGTEEDTTTAEREDTNSCKQSGKAKGAGRLYLRAVSLYSGKVLFR